MQKYSGLLFGLCSIVVCLIAAELFLWQFAPVPDPYYKYPEKEVNQYVSSEFKPNYTITTEAEEGLSGIEGQNVFSVNRFGFRGDPLAIPKPENELRIFILGASVAECFYLDDSEAVNTVLQRELTKKLSKDISVKVYNAGKSAGNTDDWISMLSQRIVHLEPDMIIIIGASDVYAGIDNHDYLHYLHESPQEKIPVFRFMATEFQIPRRVFYFLKRLKSTDQEVMETVAQKTNYKKMAKRAHAAPVTDEIPRVDLKPFSINLRSIIGIAKTHNIKLILTISQNTWNSPDDPRIKDWHWAHYSVKKKTRYREDRMSEVFEKYDRVVHQIAAESSVPVLDLTKTMPKSLEYFYDDAHYNVKGADNVGKQLASFIIEQGLDRE